jgi:hypothetical protein
MAGPAKRSRRARSINPANQPRNDSYRRPFAGRLSAWAGGMGVCPWAISVPASWDSGSPVFFARKRARRPLPLILQTSKSLGTLVSAAVAAIFSGGLLSSPSGFILDPQFSRNPQKSGGSRVDKRNPGAFPSWPPRGGAGASCNNTKLCRSGQTGQPFGKSPLTQGGRGGIKAERCE